MARIRCHLQIVCSRRRLLLGGRHRTDPDTGCATYTLPKSQND
jgi:hypothetical protein